jgi:hypothetical protein
MEMKAKVDLWTVTKPNQQQSVLEKGERWVSSLMEMSADLTNCNNFEMAGFFSPLLRDTCNFIDPISKSPLARIAGQNRWKR